MPSLEDYEALAPFSLDELVDAANAILRARPSLRIQARTVRFYITKGLLPPPTGAPKFARYSVDHLRRLISIREGQDQGLRLDEVRDSRDATLLQGPPPARRRAVADAVAAQPVHRYQLTPRATLDLTNTDNIRGELQAAQRALAHILATLNDTT